MNVQGCYAFPAVNDCALKAVLKYYRVYFGFIFQERHYLCTQKAVCMSDETLLGVEIDSFVVDCN